MLEMIDHIICVASGCVPRFWRGEGEVVLGVWRGEREVTCIVLTVAVLSMYIYGRRLYFTLLNATQFNSVLILHRMHITTTILSSCPLLLSHPHSPFTQALTQNITTHRPQNAPHPPPPTSCIYPPSYSSSPQRASNLQRRQLFTRRTSK